MLRTFEILCNFDRFELNGLLGLHRNFLITRIELKKYVLYDSIIY